MMPTTEITTAKQTATTMAALELAIKARLNPVSNPVARLYRSIIKEVPRVLTIYDLDTPVGVARKGIRAHFEKNANVRDERVVSMLVERGFMELEETLLQHKQASHLARVFDDVSHLGVDVYAGATRKALGPNPTLQERFARRVGP